MCGRLYGAVAVGTRRRVAEQAGFDLAVISTITTDHWLARQGTRRASAGCARLRRPPRGYR